MNDKLVIYSDSSNEFRWRRVSTNGQTVTVPGEGFTVKYSAVRSAVKRNRDVAPGNVYDATSGTERLCTSVLVSRYLNG